MILKPIFKLVQPLQICCYFMQVLGALGKGLFDSIPSLISGAINSAEARKAREWQEEMWHKQNEYNLPQNQIKRLQDAGLNPAILAAGGTANTSAPIPSSPARGNWDIKSSGLLSAIKDDKIKDQQLKLLEEELEQRKITTKTMGLDYTRKLYEKDNGFWSFPADMNAVQKDYIISQTKKINEEITTMIENRQYAKNAESRAAALHTWDLKIKQSIADGAKYDLVLKQANAELAKLTYEEKQGLKELGFDPNNPPLNNIQQYQYWLDTKNKELQNQTTQQQASNKKIEPLVNILNSLGPLGSILGAGVQFLYPLFDK